MQSSMNYTSFHYITAIEAPMGHIAGIIARMKNAIFTFIEMKLLIKEHVSQNSLVMTAQKYTF